MLETQESEDSRLSTEKGDWVVDLKEGDTFGDVIKHGLDDGVIYMSLPVRSGWKPLEKGMMLSHQTYAKHIDNYLEENGSPRKIAVVNVDSGEWQTVWETREKWRLSDTEAE